MKKSVNNESSDTYIITDGKKFVTTDPQGKQDITPTKKFAERLEYEEAKQRLITSAALKGFYLEGGNPIRCITRKQILKEIKNTGQSETELHADKIDGIVAYVNDMCDRINNIAIPERKRLIVYKELLQREVTMCETILFDIKHWIRAHRPRANIMVMVYVKQNYYEVRREMLKEKIRQLEIIIDEFSDESYSFPLACKKLQDSKIQPYNPRTSVYAELDALLNTKVNNSNRRNSKGAKDNVDIQETQITEKTCKMA